MKGGVDTGSGRERKGCISNGRKRGIQFGKAGRKKGGFCLSQTPERGIRRVSTRPRSPVSGGGGKNNHFSQSRSCRYGKPEKFHGRTALRVRVHVGARVPLLPSSYQAILRASRETEAEGVRFLFSRPPRPGVCGEPRENQMRGQREARTMRAAERMSAVTLAPERLQGAYDAMCRTYAANLRRIRKARGFKRYGAALALGVSASTWSRWEAGQRFPTPPLLAGIALLLQTPVADFFAPVATGSGNGVSSV